MEIALAIVVDTRRAAVLIARRRDGAHLAGYWEFPGGKVEPGETPLECAVREVSEETGLSVAPVAEWDAVVYEYPDRTVELHPFLCEAHAGEAGALASVEIAWATADVLAEYLFPPANGPILARLTEHLRTLLTEHSEQ